MKYTLGILATLVCSMSLGMDYKEIQKELVLQEISNQASTPGIPRAETCTDFSGEWKGICVFAPSSSQLPTKMTVKQTRCDIIAIGEKKYPINGSILDSSTSNSGFLSASPYAFNMYNQPAWGKDQIKLYMIDTGVHNSIGAKDPHTISVKALETWTLIDKNTLNISIPIEFLRIRNGEVATTKVLQNCTMTKQ